MNDTDEMDALYSDAKPAAKPGAKPKPKSVDEMESEQMAKTALVPLDCLKRKDGSTPAEGETCTVRVASVHGDQAEIVYVDSPDKNEVPDELDSSVTAAGDGDDGYESMLRE